MMEKANPGLEYATEVSSEQVTKRAEELTDLQLALVGGGCGETVFH
jgi:hypothetical protein